MEFFNSFLCGMLMPFLLVTLGILFAIKLKFFYVLHPIRTLKTIKNGQKEGFKSLSVALAGTLGVGNIIGVSSAILFGGAGSIFWMWVSALCAMSIKYAEVYLAMIFRQRNKDTFHGGAPYYIKNGLKKRVGASKAYSLSVIFAIFCILNSLTTGNLVQINSASSLFPSYPLVFGALFALFSLLAIRGGIKRISTVSSVLIPVLTICYVALCSIVIFSQIRGVPNVFKKIITDAFSFKSAVSGFLGHGISATVRYGVCRGVLSNEAGCGTSPAAHASSECTDPHSQACLGIFEVFVDTILLCTLTAIVILLNKPTGALGAMDLVISSFKSVLGQLGGQIIALISVLFAFATVICQYFYGTEALNYISKNKKIKQVFLFLFLLVIIIGSVIPMSLMWQISDFSIAAMTILNLFCLFLLRNHFYSK